MKNLPTLKQMQYLKALSEAGSFNKAADMCFVTQSTLSAGIASMEDILGHDLIDRSQRKLKFTPLGQKILEQSAQIIQLAEETLYTAKALNEPMSGPLRMGIIPTIAPYLLPGTLTEIYEQFPKLDIQLHEDLSENLVRKIKNRDLDLALMAFPYKSTGIEEYDLFEEEFVLAAPEGLYNERDKATLATLNGENILLLNEGHCLRDHALEACHLDAYKNRKTYSATSLATLIQMVEQGMGATLLPEMAAKSITLSKKTRVIRFTRPAPKRTIGICWQKGNSRKDDFIKLGEFIKQSARN